MQGTSAHFHVPCYASTAGSWAQQSSGLTILKAVPTTTDFKGLILVISTPRRTQASWWWVLGCLPWLVYVAEGAGDVPRQPLDVCFLSACACFMCWDLSLNQLPCRVLYLSFFPSPSKNIATLLPEEERLILSLYYLHEKYMWKICTPKQNKNQKKSNINNKCNYFFLLLLFILFIALLSKTLRMTPLIRMCWLQ